MHVGKHFCHIGSHGVCFCCPMPGHALPIFTGTGFHETHFEKGGPVQDACWEAFLPYRVAWCFFLPPSLANFYRHRFSRNPFWKKRGPCKMHVAKHFCLIGSRGIFFCPPCLIHFYRHRFCRNRFLKKRELVQDACSEAFLHYRVAMCFLGPPCLAHFYRHRF